MSSKGPIRVAVDDEEVVAQIDQKIDGDILELPEQKVLNAGINKFREYANLHWPTRSTPDEKFKLASFDHRNDYHLRVTLGMVFLAMKAADDERSF